MREAGVEVAPPLAAPILDALLAYFTGDGPLALALDLL